MSARDLLAACRRHGVRLWLDGDAVRFACDAGSFPAELRAALNAARSDLVACLRRVGAAQTAPVTDWSDDDRERYEERAAIREFDGGQARSEAERAGEDEVRRAMLRESGS